MSREHSYCVPVRIELTGGAVRLTPKKSGTEGFFLEYWRKVEVRAYVAKN